MVKIQQIQIDVTDRELRLLKKLKQQIKDERNLSSYVWHDVVVDLINKNLALQ